jgi:hypothetical protein
MNASATAMPLGVYVLLWFIYLTAGVLTVAGLWRRRRNPDWPMRRYTDAEGREWIYAPAASSDGGAGDGGGHCGGDGGGH